MSKHDYIKKQWLENQLKELEAEKRKVEEDHKRLENQLKELEAEKRKVEEDHKRSFNQLDAYLQQAANARNDPSGIRGTDLVKCINNLILDSEK